MRSELTLLLNTITVFNNKIKKKKGPEVDKLNEISIFWSGISCLKENEFTTDKANKFFILNIQVFYIHITC